MELAGDNVERYDVLRRTPIYRLWWRREIQLYHQERQRAQLEQMYGRRKGWK